MKFNRKSGSILILGLIMTKCFIFPQVTEDERNTIEIVRRTANSVVFVTNISIVRDFFLNEAEVPRGSGSGFVWDDKGHIVTNYHVIEDGDIFNIMLPDQQQRQARLVGKEEYKDIAVLQIEGGLKGLEPVRVGKSSELQVGQKVIAIGNPFGFDHTVTTGIVSALGRNIMGEKGITIRDMIQTDASINPGNSGGPLLNSKGELIGMNTSIYSPTGMYSGLGFAVPVDTIKKIVPQLIEHGQVIHPGFGVKFLPDTTARRVRIEGVIIAEVPSGSEADRAGLKGLTRNRRGQWVIQDVIVGIDDLSIKSYDDLYNALDNFRIGDSVKLKIMRDDKIRTLRFNLVRMD